MVYQLSGVKDNGHRVIRRETVVIHLSESATHTIQEFRRRFISVGTLKRYDHVRLAVFDGYPA